MKKNKILEIQKHIKTHNVQLRCFIMKVSSEVYICFADLQALRYASAVGVCNLDAQHEWCLLIY